MARQQGWFALILARMAIASAAVAVRDLSRRPAGGLTPRRRVSSLLEVRPAGSITNRCAPNRAGGGRELCSTDASDGLGLSRNPLLQTVGDEPPEPSSAARGDRPIHARPRELGNDGPARVPCAESPASRSEMREPAGRLRGQLRSVLAARSRQPTRSDADDDLDRARGVCRSGAEGARASRARPPPVNQEQLEQLLANADHPRVPIVPSPPLSLARILTRCRNVQGPTAATAPVGQSPSASTPREATGSPSSPSRLPAPKAACSASFWTAAPISEASVGPQYKAAGHHRRDRGDHRATSAAEEAQ